jgi:4a-hydroxytetrahydrobiopterin dehydratase
MPLPVVFYTRRDCPLCDKAKAAIRASAVDVALTEVDIDDDPELRRRFTDDVPLVYIHGQEAFRHFVHPQEFAAYVRGLTTNSLADEPIPAAPAKLDYDEVRALLTQLHADWNYHNAHDLRRDFRFPDFARALAFTNRVGALAEAMGHHPDIALGWGNASVTIWTHDAGGVTRADFILAARIDRVA